MLFTRTCLYLHFNTIILRKGDTLMSEEIKNCPMCGEEILAVAKKCKHCGEMIPEEPSDFMKKIESILNPNIPTWLTVTIVVVVIVILGTLPMWAKKENSTDSLSSYASTDSLSSYASYIIKEELKDPDSFILKSSSVVWKGATHAGEDAYVVKVIYKATNGFGAYLQSCNYVPFYMTTGSKFAWKKFVMDDTCDKTPLVGGESKYVDILRKWNFEK